MQTSTLNTPDEYRARWHDLKAWLLQHCHTDDEKSTAGDRATLRMVIGRMEELETRPRTNPSPYEERLGDDVI